LVDIQVAGAGCSNTNEPAVNLDCLCAGGAFNPSIEFYGQKCGDYALYLPFSFGSYDTCEALVTSADTKPTQCRAGDSLASQNADCEQRLENECEVDDLCTIEPKMLDVIGAFCCEGGAPPSGQCLCNAGVWTNEQTFPNLDQSEDSDEGGPADCGEFANFFPALGGCDMIKSDPDFTNFGLLCCHLTQAEKDTLCASTEAQECLTRCAPCMDVDGDWENDANGDPCDLCENCNQHIQCLNPTAPDPTPDPTTTAMDPTSTATDPTSTPLNPTTTAAEPTSTATDPTSTPLDPTTTVADPTSTATDPTSTPLDPTTTAAEPTITATDPTTAAAEPTSNAADPTTEAVDPAEDDSREYDTDISGAMAAAPALALLALAAALA